MRIIGIHGAAGSGKDTAAEFLVSDHDSRGWAAKGMLPVLVKLLANLDQTWPYLRVAARAFELVSKRGKLPTPEAAGHAVAVASRELLNDKLARYWLQLKPIWGDPPEVV